MLSLISDSVLPKASIRFTITFASVQWPQATFNIFTSLLRKTSSGILAIICSHTSTESGLPKMPLRRLTTLRIVIMIRFLCCYTYNIQQEMSVVKCYLICDSIKSFTSSFVHDLVLSKIGKYFTALLKPYPSIILNCRTQFTKYSLNKKLSILVTS